MLDKLDILIIILIIVIIIVKFYKKQENYKYLDKEIYMIRPNCPQLNDYNTCVSTPGCRYINQSRDNIELAVAGNMPGVGGEGCINHYEDLRDENIPVWEKNNFMIVRD
jgi:hypothetical protein